MKPFFVFNGMNYQHTHNSAGLWYSYLRKTTYVVSVLCYYGIP